MQSNGARIAVVAVAIAALVGLFLVLSNDKAKTPTTASVATTTQQQEPRDPDKEKKEKQKEKPDPKPEVPTIEVKGGAPVGGVQELEFVAGERMLFKITSDQDAEFHLHGYDVEQSVAAGGETTFDLAADIEGVFELEDHETAEPIGEVTVAPG